MSLKIIKNAHYSITSVICSQFCWVCLKITLTLHKDISVETSWITKEMTDQLVGNDSVKYECSQN